jgi:hypothetical protein
MRSAWPIRRENRAFSIIRQQQNKTSRTGKRAIQLAGSAVEGSLDLDLILLVLSSFPAMAAWSLSRWQADEGHYVIFHQSKIQRSRYFKLAPTSIHNLVVTRLLPSCEF